MADVVATSSQPALGAIRLAWWREQLEELDAGEDAPAEPRLKVLQADLLPQGVGGAELARLEDAWLPLLDDFPWGQAQVDGLTVRGSLLFGIGARLLGAEPSAAEDGGIVWSLLDAVGHCSDPQSRSALLNAARKVDLRTGAPKALRPLTVLVALAMTEITDPSGGLARGMAALRHRATGRFPQL